MKKRPGQRTAEDKLGIKNFMPDQTEQRHDEEELAEDYRWLWNTVRGKRILHDLAQQCEYNQPGSTSNAFAMSAHIAKQNIFVRIRKLLGE